MSRDIERQKAKALNVIDARDLIKAKFPAILPHLSAAQLDQIQRQLDAFFINLDIDRQLEELDRKSIVGRTREGRAVHDESKRVSQDTLMKVKKNRIVSKEGNVNIRLEFEKLLAPGALKPTSDNPDEAVYLLMVKAALATHGVWLKIFRNSSQIGRTAYAAPNDHRGWFAVLYYGGDKESEIQTDTGQLTRKAILGVTRIGAGYYNYVHNGPTLRLLRAAINAASSKVRVMVALHHDYAPKSLRGKALDWGIRQGARMGGVSVEVPDEKIWDEPSQLLTKSLDLINDGKLGEANKLVILASYQAEWNADAVMQYVNLVEAVKPGVKVGLRVLEIADTLGKIADAILLVRSAGKGLFKLLSGKPSPPALPPPGTSSPSRQLPAGGPSSASNPVDAYANTIRSAENAVQPAARSAPAGQSVAPRSNKMDVTLDGSIPPPPKSTGFWNRSDKAQEAWFGTSGYQAYQRDLKQYMDYVARELKHLRKVNPNPTMAQKNAIIERADRHWGSWLPGDGGGYPSKYWGEAINVDVK